MWTSGEGLQARLFLALLGLGAAAVVVLAAAGAGSGGGGEEQAAQRALVAELRLTDLALWSDTGYCRHPSQADRFAPWAVHPAAVEAYPAGSFVPPGGGAVVP